MLIILCCIPRIFAENTFECTEMKMGMNKCSELLFGNLATVLDELQ